jgi:antitoxin ParD1/3/4
MAMNVKTTITLQEDYLRYAEKMVEEGIFPSTSSLVEAGLARILHGDTLAGPLTGLADEIRRRMELPRDQWISTKDENLLDRVRARIAAR